MPDKILEDKERMQARMMLATVNDKLMEYRKASEDIMNLGKKLALVLHEAPLHPLTNEPLESEDMKKLFVNATTHFEKIFGSSK